METAKRLSPQERLKALEQKQTKLAEKAAKIREQLRKKESNLKIKLGGLIFTAGLENEPENVLLGILVQGAKRLEAERGTFEALGRTAFVDAKKARAEEKAQAKKAKEDAAPANASPRFYLDVPIEEKDEAKALGARWEPALKKWYCDPADKAKFAKWWPKEA